MCSLSYYGETGRPFKTRLKEHKGNVNYGHTDKSAVALHAYETGHPPKWEESKLVYISGNWYARTIVESALIGETVNYNRKEGTRVIDRATRRQIFDALPKLKNSLYLNG